MALNPASQARGSPVGRPVVFDSTAVILACGLLLGFYAAGMAACWAGGGTLFGWRGRSTQDFAVFWGAGLAADAGRPAAAYDWSQLRPMLEALLGRPAVEIDKTFLYPPIFLLLLMPLGLLPFAAAAAVWLGGTAAAYLAAVRAILPGGAALLAALAAPAVLFNAMAGQNGLLTAALLGGALALLDTAPAAAGVLIGLMAYKPQFGPLLPLLLIVTGRWRTLGAAAATFVALFAAAAALLGTAPFAAFIAASSGFAGAFSHGPRQLHWDRLASLYALLRATGAGAASAWSAHLALALTAAAVSLRLAVSRAPDMLKLAAIPIAVLLIAPYSELTDLAVLTIAMACLVRDGLCRGWRRRDSATLAAAFVLPLALIVAPGLRQLTGLENVAALAGPADCALLAAMIAWRVPAAAAAER